jgi:hypothetical protein
MVLKQKSHFQFILNLILSFVILYFLYYAYNYTKSLEHCECVSALKHNIDSIKNIEFILIIINIIGIILNISVHLFKFSIFKYATTFIPLIWFYMIFMVFMIVIFVYNVYVFGANLSTNCDCANKWQKDILFIQSGLYSLSALMVITTTGLSLWMLSHVSHLMTK